MKGEKLYTGGRPDLLFDIVKGRDLVRGKIDTQQYMSYMRNIICFAKGGYPKNKTISDGGITVHFWFIKVHTSN